MKKQIGPFRYFSILLVLAFASGSAGCNLGTPVCPDNSLKAVILGAPQTGTITNNLSPVLSWSYPDSTCHPESYWIFLGTVANIPETLQGTSDGHSTTWGPDTPLKPGMEYEWWVLAMNGSHAGPQPPLHIFYTGPMCQAAYLHAPILDIPWDGAVVHPPAQIVWHYPDPCLPQSYHVQVSVDPTFADQNIAGNTGSPSMTWDNNIPLADCTTYFVRVFAVNDNLAGPFSNVNHFFVNREDECYNHPEAPASVGGILWYDQCPIALNANPVPNPLPDGCLLDSYRVDGDARHQPAEPRINNITVNLAVGDCAKSPTRSTVTDVNGNYQFTGLTPGMYCISVNAMDLMNPDGMGHWTLIASHEGKSYRPVLVSAGTTLTDQNFAWYQFTGIVSTPTATGSFFTPSMNANCRNGPGPTFGILGMALKGTSYPLDGRNQDGDWARIMLNASQGCWLMSNSGVPSGDLSGVRVLLTPNLPTPTLVAACSDNKSQSACESQPGCKWFIKPGTTAHPVCTNN